MNAQHTNRPPRLAQWLLRRCYGSEHRLGDFLEMFQRHAEERGRARAWFYYWRHAFQSINAQWAMNFIMGVTMIKAYVLTAWRAMKKQRLFTVINVAGLSMGLAAFILITLYVTHEFSYDRHHAHHDQMFLVTNPEFAFGPSAITPAPLGPILQERFPEVESVVRFRHYGNKCLLAANEQGRYETGLFWADPSVIDDFSLDVVKGDSETALKQPYGLMLSESAARKYFGDEPALGRTLFFEDIYVGRHDFQVTGIFRDMPENSHFRMDVIAPFSTFGQLSGRDLERWGFTGYQTYVRLRPGADVEQLIQKMNPIIQKISGDDAQYALMPITDIHLWASQYQFTISSQGSIQTVTLFTSIALVILFIACINYMNLSSARAIRRGKELGLRKVIGARRSQLIGQQLGESLLVTALAGVLALILVAWGLPEFRRIMDRPLSLQTLLSPGGVGGLLLLWLVVGLSAGAYTAFRLTRASAVALFRMGSLARVSGGARLRNGLVLFQFIISIAMILSALMIDKQLRFIRNTDMGFQWKDIGVVRVRDAEARNQWGQIKAAMERIPGVLAVSGAQHLPNNNNSWTGARWPGQEKGKRLLICENVTDLDYLRVFGIETVAGRGFIQGQEPAYLLNESAVKTLGWEDPLNRLYGREDRNQAGPVVGVIKDYHLRPLYEAIQPMYIRFDTQRSYSYLCMKMTADHQPEIVEAMRQIMQHYAPKYPFDYATLESLMGQAYQGEMRLARMIQLFSFLAIAISGLGLLGLAAYEVERRVKEIGIRKVLGATVAGVAVQMIIRFVRWAALASLVACPLAIWMMGRWLHRFAYRTYVDGGTVLLSVALALVTAVGIVAVQSIRAAQANPVHSLKQE